MKTFCALTLALLSVSVGCGGSVKDRLQGKWQGREVENIDPSTEMQANLWVRGTSMEFSGNKVTVGVLAESPRSGTYKIVQNEGEKVRLQFVRQEGGTDDVELTFTPDKKLRWNIGEGRSILLARAEK